VVCARAIVLKDGTVEKRRVAQMHNGQLADNECSDLRPHERTKSPLPAQPFWAEDVEIIRLRAAGQANHMLSLNSCKLIARDDLLSRTK
jgi:hypothetical protein